MKKKESWKEEIARAYSQKALDYERRKVDFIEKFFQRQLEDFVEAVKQTGGKKVLDLGSGPGRDSLLFKKAGLEPISVDIAPAMVERCQRLGLKAMVMDFYDLDFSDQSFDGVWANFSLLHAPKKDLPQLLSESKRVLKPGGIFFIAMYEGEGEGLKKSHHYQEERYFAYYQPEELESLLNQHFKIEKGGRIDTGREGGERKIVLYYQCRNE